jgi:hypothetical protein
MTYAVFVLRFHGRIFRRMTMTLSFFPSQISRLTVSIDQLTAVHIFFVRLPLNPPIRVYFTFDDAVYSQLNVTFFLSVWYYTMCHGCPSSLALSLSLCVCVSLALSIDRTF